MIIIVDRAHNRFEGVTLQGLNQNISLAVHGDTDMVDFTGSLSLQKSFHGTARSQNGV